MSAPKRNQRASGAIECGQAGSVADSLLTLSDLHELAEMALAEHGLRDEGWSFRWDRAVSRAGCCNYRSRTISLSLPIFTIEQNREEALDTILHEVAHALAGRAAGHGPRWREVAVAVGARPERCHSLATPEAPLIGVCGCGPRHQRVRRPPRGSRYVCRACSIVIRWSWRSDG